MNESYERNCRVQARFDILVHQGAHGFYETLFTVVREEIERMKVRMIAKDCRICFSWTGKYCGNIAQCVDADLFTQRTQIQGWQKTKLETE